VLFEVIGDQTITQTNPRVPGNEPAGAACRFTTNNVVPPIEMAKE
jgi:hypothetical protein